MLSSDVFACNSAWIVVAPACSQKHLSYNTRARVAIALANCHLAKSGLRSHPCPEDEPLQSCTQAMGRDSVAFVRATPPCACIRRSRFRSSHLPRSVALIVCLQNTYNTFFAHVDNICFYVQREAFQETTERAVADLLSATVDTSRHLQRFSTEVSGCLFVHVCMRFSADLALRPTGHSRVV